MSDNYYVWVDDKRAWEDLSFCLKQLGKYVVDGFYSGGAYAWISVGYNEILLHNKTSIGGDGSHYRLPKLERLLNYWDPSNV